MAGILLHFLVALLVNSVYTPTVLMDFAYIFDCVVYTGWVK